MDAGVYGEGLWLAQALLTFSVLLILAEVSTKPDRGGSQPAVPSVPATENFTLGGLEGN
jgi:hypothetical protein